MKILVCEDDEILRLGLHQVLEAEGYSVLSSTNAEDALLLFHSEKPEFVCLDVMLPGASGLDLCREIRRIQERVPIIFISAKGTEIDRVVGLELGADDYIVKPFGMSELLSRIRAILRRSFCSASLAKEQFKIADLIVRPNELRAKKGSSTIELSLRDIRILELLLREEGNVVGRDKLFDECWGLNHVPNSRTLDQHISKLRKKIGDDPKQPSIIETVHGVGYRYGGRYANL